MKRTLLCCFLLLLSSVALAGLRGARPTQPDDALQADFAVEGKGRRVFLTGDLGRLGRGFDETAFVDGFTQPFRGEDDAQSLRVKRRTTDKLGTEHTRIQQFLYGIPVVGAELIVHSDSSSGQVYAINGMFADGADLAHEPSVTPDVALQNAMDLSNIRKGSIQSKAELVYILKDDGVVFLAWSADIQYLDADGDLQLDRVFADASGGKNVARHPRHFYAKNRRTHHGNYSQSLPGTLRRSEGQGPIGDAAIDDAHDNGGITYDYYQAKFNRDSYDNRGAALVATAHHQQNHNNAYWNGSQMIYGDGDGQQFTYFSKSLDVVAHELTHAVTGAESGLIYQNESGALNEALSDIFGVAATVWHDGGINSNTWKLGEDVYTPNTPGDALRYMDNPTADGRSYDYYPERYTGSQDNGGVHINSGIANLAFYLMVEGGTHPRGKTSVQAPAIGLDKAEQIFYRAQTTYLNANSNFQSMRNATAQAAADLYGAAEVSAVHKAWCVVGVPGGGSNCDGGTDPCPGGNCPPQGCSATPYTGYVTSGSQAFEPNGTYYYAGSGSHVGQLSSSAQDLDLYLWKWNGYGWSTVATSGNADSAENISYSGSGGYYVWRIHAYSGSGSYELCTQTP